MNDKHIVRELIVQWTKESDEYRAEAIRLESFDWSRHATSIVMLGARASALNKCIVNAESRAKS